MNTNTFNVTGYAVNKRGLTVGIAYQVEAEDGATARDAGLSMALTKGMTYPRVLRVVLAPVDDLQLVDETTTTHSVEVFA